MRDLINLPAESLLKITAPELLFSRSASEATAEFRDLARRWHPDLDRTTIAPRVFSHIVVLHKLALRKIADGSWNDQHLQREKGSLATRAFEGVDGRSIQFNYHSRRTIELGEMYIAEHSVLFDVPHEFSDLLRSGCKRISNLRYRDHDMAVEMSKFLPQIENYLETKGSTVISIRKTPDQLLLTDVLKHCNGQLPQIEHSGWIINNLLNIACYLEWAGLTHNDISTETVFISPRRHTAQLLGGWWYSARVGQRLVALPNRSMRIIPPEMILSRKASTSADFKLIKELLAESLGARDGSPLSKSTPEQLRKFLQTPSKNNAPENYAFWKYEVLPPTFGAPKFITWNLESNHIY